MWYLDRVNSCKLFNIITSGVLLFWLAHFHSCITVVLIINLRENTNAILSVIINYVTEFYNFVTQKINNTDENLIAFLHIYTSLLILLSGN